MIKETVTKIKERFLKKNEGNDKKTIENLIVFIIILIVTIVMINYIWNDESKEEVEYNTNTKILASEETENKIFNENDMESRLENILKKIKGVGDVNVLITYSQTSVVIPMYNEDTSQTMTEESDSGGGTRTVNETVNKKDIVYEENNGSKVPVTQSTINPTIEGAIVTAQGAENAEIKTNIIQAIEAATGLATHKIQVFEME